ncbi:DEAD/DEAH box helicase [Nocardia sp. CC227C]|uniref:DEAD/DEAH box helicase n=1 Tax=Nocardia sp. CC227C TaxID=3044562 RepID=UPI00278BDB1E|nr:AAA domain-containing protein [Nocardia sp. CC227C]
MGPSRKDGQLKAIRELLADEPLTTDELLGRLEARGIRRLDPTDLYLLLHESRVAEFDKATGRWYEPGRPADAGNDRTGSREQSADSGGKAGNTNAALRRELRSLRERTVRDAEAPGPQTVPMADGWKEIAAAARSALTFERQAAVSKTAWQNTELVDGEILEETPARRIVRYEIQGSDSVREGTTATLLPPEGMLGQHNGGVDVAVLTQYGSEITIDMAADHPFWERARLRCDLSYLVTEQSCRFSELLAGPVPGFDTAAALQPVTADGVLDQVPDVEPYTGAGLNDRQRLAVAHGLCTRLTWLWGPPGTGKTTTLAALLAELLDRGKTILLAAPTNAAIDVALSALVNRRPQWPSGAVVRIGPTDNDVLTGRKPAVLLDEIAAEQGAEPARRLVEIRGELAALRDLHRTVPDNDPSRAQERTALVRKIRDLEGFVKGLVELLGDVRDQVITRGQLIACTSHQIVLKEVVRRKDFDVVVIDEASMMTAAMTMLVAGTGAGHTIVAGDFRQLPPIVQSAESLAREWLGQSAFEKSSVARAVGSDSSPANLVALETQHRMRPSIGGIIGTAFYPEVGLATAPSVRHRPTRTISDDEPQLLLIDTSDLRAPLARREGMSSRYNVMHAQLAANVVTAQLRGATEPGSVGLISPFAPQARLLHALAPERDSRVLASTVHRFQGGETDVVLYDAVESSGSDLQPHSWFTKTQAGSEGARLLNVAMSRAREQVILLADMGRIHRGQPAQPTPVRRFLNLLKREAQEWTWRAVAQGPGPTRVENDLRALGDDLASASECVEIFSETVDGPETRWILDILSELPETVKVGFWFGRAGIGSVVEQALSKHHTTLHPLRRCRESFVVIDSVLWSAQSPILGRAPGLLLRTGHSGLARAVRRQSLRRTVRGVPGTGQSAERCACGSLRMRAEINGGPRAGIHSLCPRCRS